VSAIRTTPHDGNGAAASIRDRLRGEHQSGTAASLAEARADLESAWKIFLPTRTEADFQEWRDQRDWTERKYAMRGRGERVSPRNSPR
jgi:hypothetical protein